MKSRLRRSVVVSGLLFVVVAATAQAQDPPPSQNLFLPRRDVLLTRDWHYTVQNLGTLSYGNLLGVEVAPVEATLRAQLGIDAEIGLVVCSLPADGQAAKGDLRQHDIILKIGDKAVANQDQLNEIVQGSPGKELDFKIIRQGKPSTLKIKLPEVPVVDLTAKFFQPYAFAPQYRIGVTLADADETLRSQLRLASGEGLVVTEVVADSPAAKAGIRQHDVLTKLDGKRVTNVAGVNEQIQSIKDRQVTVVIFRAGQEVSCDVMPQLSNDSTAPYPLAVTDWNFTPTAISRPLNVLWATDRIQYPAPYSTFFYGTAAPANTAEQLANAKRQLEELQKTLEALGAALATQQQQLTPPAPSSEQKK